MYFVRPTLPKFLTYSVFHFSTPKSPIRRFMYSVRLSFFLAEFLLIGKKNAVQEPYWENEGDRLAPPPKKENPTKTPKLLKSIKKPNEKKETPSQNLKILL